MMRIVPLVAAALLTAACDRAKQPPVAEPDAPNSMASASPVPAPAPDAPAPPAAGGEAERSGGGKAVAPAVPAAPPAAVSPCLTQGGERLEVAPLRAIGTEPFWGARIEGRCVTYSHPEDQTGTRVWTRYTAATGGGTWSGMLGGRRFELRTRPRPGCSDGMSDKVYPIAVDLLVGGERRTGCAEPA